MLIGDAETVYFGDTEAYKLYVGENLVWSKLEQFYLISNNYTGTQGLTVGTSVTKDMDNAVKTTAASYVPGPEQLRTRRSYIQSWGDDIFNAWGFFYIYNPATGNYLSPVLQQINQADGTIATETFTLDGRTFTIKHGYPAQGIYKFNITVNDEQTFIFGMDGNLGSNGSTSNMNMTQAYSKLDQNFTLHYNYNVQTSVPSEKFYTYFVPYERDQNLDTRPYLRFLYSADNLAMYTNPVKYGLNVYLAKQNDVNSWVINDLQLSTI
jgi:hypothetical protein